MQIVIDIPEEVYNGIISRGTFISDFNLSGAIANGTVLPKGHGDLIDRDKIACLRAIYDAKHGYITWTEATKRIRNSAPTIIEADKGDDTDENS